MAASMWFNLLIDHPTQNADFISRGDPTRLHEDKLLELDRRANIQQYHLDAALWYGAINSGPYSDILRKLFHIFYYAGVIYSTGKLTWDDWSNNQANVASLLSHGQRVLVQIPSSSKGGDALWPWLTRTDNIAHRAGATHGQSHESKPKLLIAGHYKKVSEKHGKGQSLSGLILRRHYGFNVALGGIDNRNPFSAANNDQKHTYLPIKADGKNGHVYINYMSPSKDAVGGMLVGCENAQFGKGENPHTKAVHGLGARQQVSACGGKKWSQWNCGPRQEYNGFICDLTDRGQNLDWLLNSRLFDEDWLDAHTQKVAQLGQLQVVEAVPRRAVLLRHVA